MTTIVGKKRIQFEIRACNPGFYYKYNNLKIHNTKNNVSPFIIIVVKFFSLCSPKNKQVLCKVGKTVVVRQWSPVQLWKSYSGDVVTEC